MLYLSVSGLFFLLNYLSYHILWVCYMMQTLFYYGCFVRKTLSKQPLECAEQPLRQKNVSEGWIHVGWETVSGFIFYVKVVSAGLQWIILFVPSEVVFQTCVLNGLCIIQGHRISMLALMNRDIPLGSVMAIFHSFILFHCASLISVELLPSSAQVFTSTTFLLHIF